MQNFLQSISLRYNKNYKKRKILKILAFDNQLIILKSPYMLEDKIIKIFVHTDDFYIEFSDQIKHFRLEDPNTRLKKLSW